LDERAKIAARIEKIKRLAHEDQGSIQYFEAASLAQTVLHDTVGGSHPLTGAIQNALEKGDWQRAVAAARGVVTLFEHDALTSPRLAIAHEIEGDLLDIAQSQLQGAETTHIQNQKQLQLALAAFLAGAALEDALRRLCMARGITFDPQRASIAKLQAALYQPSKQIEIISGSENKQITAWGDSRNKADHAKFAELTHSEVLAMVVGGPGVFGPSFAMKDEALPNMPLHLTATGRSRARPSRAVLSLTRACCR
jgi:hypothetical protein